MVSMNSKAVEDLLENGILVETTKGVIRVGANEAIKSHLKLSLKDLQDVAAHLLHDQNSVKMKVHTSTDSLGDSDGFTSESSETNSLFQNVVRSLNIPSVLGDTKCNSLKQTTDLLETISSNVSDSDTGSIKRNESDLLTIPLQGNKPKKRGGWPKGRKRKPELLHLPPKAPSTGYNLYLNDQRKLFKDSTLPFHEITKLIGNKWSSLSLEEKKPYLDKAEEEKRRYREEFRSYRQSRAYQLYLANKRRKRIQNNILSESDMDATDEVDDEDNEELYCRTCDQWFHNYHNKREHLQGKQHMQSIAGAINKELTSDSECKKIPTFPPVINIESNIQSVNSIKSTLSSVNIKNQLVSEAIQNLINVVTGRESEYKSLIRVQQETTANHTALFQQLCSLKERENKLQKDLISLKGHEKDLDLKLFHLWRVPSLFIVTDLGYGTDDCVTLE